MATTRPPESDGAATRYTIKTAPWTNRRGQRLHTVSYEAPAPRAVVYFYHGYSEHLGWYKRLFTMFVEAGFSVYGFDVHGHGRSEPHDRGGRVYFRGVDNCFSDAVDFLDAVVRPACLGRPLFGVGHSFGCCMLALVEAERPGTFAGLVMNAPAVGAQMTPVMRVQLVLVDLLLLLIPSWRIVPGRTLAECFTDERVARAVDMDPLFENGNLRVATAAAILAGFARVRKRAGAIACPLYVQWGAQDLVSDRPAAELFVRSVASTSVKWEDGAADKHASIHDTQRAPVLIGAMLSWMQGVCDRL